MISFRYPKDGQFKFHLNGQEPKNEAIHDHLGVQEEHEQVDQSDRVELSDGAPRDEVPQQYIIVHASYV